MMQDVRDPDTGKLLFRFDANQDIIEVKRKNDRSVRVDLTTYRINQASVSSVVEDRRDPVS